MPTARASSTAARISSTLRKRTAQAIARGADPETSGAEGLRDLACAFAILESSALGRQVTLEEMLDGQADSYQREIDEQYGLV